MALILSESIYNEKDFDIFRKAQRFNLDLETVVFSEDEFNQDLTDLNPEIKANGIQVV